MGNYLVGFHPSGILLNKDRIHYHDNRLLHRKPSSYENETLIGMRNFFNNWKTTKNEVMYFSYRGFCGGILGLLTGMVMMPALRISPYIARKMFHRAPSNDLFPIDGAKFFFGTVAPYYTLMGASSGFVGSFLSEAYDRMFCSNVAVKYYVLGSLDGYLFTLFFGPVGSWTNGLLIGGILGLTILGYKSMSTATEGDFGFGTLYMKTATKEDRAKYLKQEERLGLPYIQTR